MTDTLLDSMLRREAQLLRYGTQLKNEHITKAMQDLSVELPKLLAGTDSLTKSEQRKVINEARRVFGARMQAMFDDITAELESLTADEADFILELYSDYSDADFSPVKTATAVSYAKNAVMSLEKGQGFVSGVWAEFVKQNIDTGAREIDGIIQRGFRDGQTGQEMTQALRGTHNRSTKRYMGGVLNGINANRAETLVRTGVTHYANRARESFQNANPILDESVFFATLDNRTTSQCLSLHLTRWKNDDPRKPVLPLHYGERSVYLFAGSGIDPTEGQRPIVGGKRGAADEFAERQSRTDRKVTYRGSRDSDIFKVEQVSAQITSQQFLERQPRWFVESTLGKTRAQLFIDGKLDIKKFTDLQGRPLTLAELRETAAGERAFRRAGIE